MEIFIGTSGFGYTSWKPLFYPQELQPTSMLRFYSRQFNTVEINNTFYRFPSALLLSKWRKEIPPGFMFSVKATRVITHIKRLRDTEGELSFFVKGIAGLKSHLGPILWQLPPGLKRDLPLLHDFIDAIPDGFSCAFQFQHESWDDPLVFDQLKRRGYTACIVDSDDSHPVNLPMIGNWGYLRLRSSSYDNRDLELWADRIQNQQWSRVFIYFKHDEPGMATKYATIMKGLMGLGPILRAA